MSKIALLLLQKSELSPDVNTFHKKVINGVIKKIFTISKIVKIYKDKTTSCQANYLHKVGLQMLSLP